MSFDISKLTSAVNKYLNSISDVGAAAQKAAQEAEDRARFPAELSNAIKQNIESKTRIPEEMPDIAAEVLNEVNSKVGSIDATFEQINGAFDAISEAGRTEPARTGNAGVQNSGIDKTAQNASTAAADIASNASQKTNFDAYSGTLSPEALKELSGSGYFTANLIQSSLFNEDEDGSLGSDNSGSSAFDNISISDLNQNSLLANSLTSGNTSDILNAAVSALSASSATASSATATSAAGTNIQGTATSAATLAGTTDGADLTKALIKAYTSSGKQDPVSSIFGDFSL